MSIVQWHKSGANDLKITAFCTTNKSYSAPRSLIIESNTNISCCEQITYGLFSLLIHISEWRMSVLVLLIYWKRTINITRAVRRVWYKWRSDTKHHSRYPFHYRLMTEKINGLLSLFVEVLFSYNTFVTFIVVAWSLGYCHGLLNEKAGFVGSGTNK